MMSFYDDKDFVRSTPAKIASYSVTLLDVGKPNRMAYSIIFPVGALSCKPNPALIWREAPYTLRIYQPASPWFASDWGSSAKKSANNCPFNSKRGLY